MRLRRLSLGMKAMVVAALLAWACSNDDPPSPPDGNHAGAGDEAGAGGSGAVSGSGGAGGRDTGTGGAGAPNDNDAVPWCGPYSLDDFCARPSRPCEIAPEDLCPRCEDGGKTLPCPHPEAASRYETTCGGFVVVQDLGLFGSQSWEFDENGELISVLSTSDAVTMCDGGGSSASTVWGTQPCERLPAETAGFCDGSGGAGGQSSSGGAGGDALGGMGGAN
jgi:hypothetical protein